MFATNASSFTQYISFSPVRHHIISIKVTTAQWISFDNNWALFDPDPNGKPACFVAYFRRRLLKVLGFVSPLLLLLLQLLNLETLTSQDWHWSAEYWNNYIDLVIQFKAFPLALTHPHTVHTHSLSFSTRVLLRHVTLHWWTSSCFHIILYSFQIRFDFAFE